MPTQIDPRDPDQPRADIERDTELGIPIRKERRTGESVGGMTRRERGIPDHFVQGTLTSDNLLHPPNDYTRADESRGQQPACLTVFVVAVSHQEQRNPQHRPAIAEVGAYLHGSAERFTAGRCIVDRIEYVLIQPRKKIALIGVSCDGDEAKEGHPRDGSENLCSHRLIAQVGVKLKPAHKLKNLVSEARQLFMCKVRIDRQRLIRGYLVVSRKLR